ncbi:MAG: hypothetical protein PVH50_12480 [Anaerolineae bacterium]|jgi:hypothetical protein
MSDREDTDLLASAKFRENEDGEFVMVENNPPDPDDPRVVRTLGRVYAYLRRLGREADNEGGHGDGAT